MIKKKNKPTSDAVEILHRRLIGNDPEKMAELEKIRAEDELERKIESDKEIEYMKEMACLLKNFVMSITGEEYEAHIIRKEKK